MKTPNNPSDYQEEALETLTRVLYVDHKLQDRSPYRPNEREVNQMKDSETGLKNEGERTVFVVTIVVVLNFFFPARWLASDT